jgi:signal transduction histidine kinase
LKHQSLPSLRIWLQSTAVLTVIAGYTVLLVINGALADLQRREQHQRLVDALTTQAAIDQLDPVPLRQLGIKASLLVQSSSLEPELQTGAPGEQWLVSRSALRLASGERRWLELHQNVSDSLEQQRMAQLLLIAAAGGSILLTALLLRPVLQRGLVVPLDDFDRQLQKLEADNLGEHLLDPRSQPQELQAIATAFNNLQQRLAAAWSRERTFVDGVAHELRTPITVISSHAQRLQRYALPAAEQRSAQLISTEAKRMADLLRVLRELARSDSGRLELQLEPLGPEEQLLFVYESLSTFAGDRLQLPHPSSELLPPLWADPVCLQECLQELIRNALLYSSGSVNLLASQIGEQVVLHVLDQGPGINPSERALVLQRFKRGTTSTGTRGTGIGLALVVELMRAMDAELMIGDAPGGGADLQLRFRAAVAVQ